jgi:hypothetical protein
VSCPEEETVKQPRTIALCDILGFKELTKSLDTLIEKHLPSFQQALHGAIHGTDAPPGTLPSLEKLKSQTRLGIGWFSDTVLLYTLDDDDENVKVLIRAVGYLLFRTMVRGWTRIRGAVAHGDTYIDEANSIFVGEPIVEAYELERRQQWSGCALTESGQNRVRDMVEEIKQQAQLLKRDPRDILPDLWLTSYPVPLKQVVAEPRPCGAGEQTKELLAVDWTLVFHPELEFPWSARAGEPNDEDRKDVVKKWKNTQKFHREQCRHCRGLNTLRR